MNNLDQTMDDTDYTRFISTYTGLIRKYTDTFFDQTEVTCIFLVYHKFVMANGPKTKMMTKKQLQKLFIIVFQIYDVFIVDRILMTITVGDMYVTPEAWIELLIVFFTENIEDRITFAFNVYNTDGTGQLNREFVTLAVERFFIGDDEDEVNELRSDMVEFIFNKFDLDKDGVITFEEYAVIVRKQTELISFLGPIFPSRKDCTIASFCINAISHFKEIN